CARRTSGAAYGRDHFDSW
nr:immunoglobulin heavy chain junction region [Macaca mulatta]MOY25156.1 immunoglobulin heavy chain junction region [Macaca mulatta]MOY27784.1 immunoglobulin heavy chain junction region [Macaca mulatta]